MNILYATDLDNTLIYSHRYIENHVSSLAEVLCIEQLNGRNISYISLEVLDALNKLAANKECTFVPITTRRLEQYNRINLGIIPEYAVVANGGIILHKGVPLQEWSEHIADSIDAYQFSRLIAEFKKLKGLTSQVNVCDNCFIFFKIVDPVEFDAVCSRLSPEYENWILARYDLKCYAFPKCCSKGRALQYLRDKLKVDLVVASGDSMLDESMLSIADLAVVPQHSCLRSLSYTYVSGDIQSPLDTMNLILSIIDKKNT